MKPRKRKEKKKKKKKKRKKKNRKEKKELLNHEIKRRDSINISWSEKN